jgi:hypothetical protein
MSKNLLLCGTCADSFFLSAFFAAKESRVLKYEKSPASLKPQGFVKKFLIEGKVLEKIRLLPGFR